MVPTADLIDSVRSETKIAYDTARLFAERSPEAMEAENKVFHNRAEERPSPHRKAISDGTPSWRG